jgi:hypothetical protein
MRKEAEMTGKRWIRDGERLRKMGKRRLEDWGGWGYKRGERL